MRGGHGGHFLAASVALTYGMRDGVVAAIEAFDAWERPWEFSSSVSGSPTLTPDDRAVAHQVWLAACDARNWQHAASAQTVVNRTLQEQFPWLTELARAQLIRAASYEWK